MMDIRGRLLIAFTPLIILLFGIIVALPFVQRQAQDVLARQIAAADDFAETQSIELNVLLINRALDQVASGDLSANSRRLAALRTSIAGLLQRHSTFAHPSEQLDQQVAALYAQLDARYDLVIAAAAAGDLAQAEALFTSSETNQLLDSLLSLSQETRDLTRSEIDRVNSEAQAIQQRTLLAVAGAFFVGVLAAIGLTWLLILQVIAPVVRLTADAERYASGTLSGQLSPVGDIRQIRRLREAFQNLIDANAARQRDLQGTLDELGQRVQREERLRQTVQALSVPVVPLQNDTLLLPLVGYFDQQRSEELIRDLLAAIQQRRARTVMLDVTGIADLDQPTAALLSRAAESARLLGCSVYLIGVQASQALILVQSQALFRNMMVARDVPSVLGQIGQP
jgi:anti-anti-sigma regulatory factor